MGQKLVTIKFGSGTNSKITDPGYSPTFRLEVQSTQVQPTQWSSVTKYLPGLTGYQQPSIPVGVDLTQQATLTSAIIRSCIINRMYLTFVADDGVNGWQVIMQEEVLSPTESAVASGSIEL